MSKRIALLVLLVAPAFALAAGGGAKPAFWQQPTINLDNKASLQRGAKLFANYCMGCHQAQYHRWMHVSEDLGIPEELVEQNLIWTTDADGKKNRAGSLMTNAMSAEYGKQVFGKQPPDLTLRARSQGPAYIYNFLQSFYLDPSSPTGVNNAVLEGAAMPHVLGPLQGWQKPVRGGDGHGGGGHGSGSEGEGPITGFELVREGRMSPEDYDRAVNDLVNFMVYLGEPARLDRTQMGSWVLFFLVIFFGVAYLLKREYWKDVH
jgi:ubiquinol-cytochrome c reductase cytochrome c1 subunit